MKRVFLIVLDSFGIGQMPDSERFGDVNVNTLRSCATSQKLNIPHMRKAGLGNIQGEEMLKFAALQVFWCILMLIIGKLWMRSALKRVVIQGG